MVRRLTEEEVKEIRELVALGALKYKIAEKFNINIKTVYQHTKDLPKKRKSCQKITEDMKEKIRKRVLENRTREDVAKEFGISYMSVCIIARGLSGKEGYPGIRGHTLKILQSIEERGYFIPNLDKTIDAGSAHSSYITLKKYFPNTIKKVECRGCVAFYDEKRKVDACRAFMSHRLNRIVSWHDYRTIMALFGICESPKESREMLGKMGYIGHPHPKRPKFKKLKIPGEQAQDSNEIGNFLLSDVLSKILFLNLDFFCWLLNTKYFIQFLHFSHISIFQI
jgi:hypothetical protein